MRFLAIPGAICLLYGSAWAQSDKSSSDFKACAVDVRWVNTNGDLTHPRSSQLPVNLTFLVHLSRGTDCSNAEVSVTATYLTDSQDFICGGTIRRAMDVSAAVQSFNIAVRPFTQLDFLRWRNQPGTRGEQLGKRLTCLNLDGTTDVGDSERQKAGWMRLSIGVMPTAGGVGVTEAIFRLIP
jgi:hypothetical protein